MLTTLLIRGVMLPNAIDGILFYIIPDWKRLADVRVSEKNLNTWRLGLYLNCLIISFQFRDNISGIDLFDFGE